MESKMLELGNCYFCQTQSAYQGLLVVLAQEDDFAVSPVEINTNKTPVLADFLNGTLIASTNTFNISEPGLYVLHLYNKHVSDFIENTVFAGKINLIQDTFFIGGGSTRDLKYSLNDDIDSLKNIPAFIKPVIFSVKSFIKNS